MRSVQIALCILGVIYAGYSTTAQAKSARATEGHQRLCIPSAVSTTDEIHFYIVDVLTRALSVTESTYGRVELEAQRESTVQTRQLLNLEKGMVDIIWMNSNSERDKRALPIPVPIIGGLYSYRVLMVRKSDERFSKPLPLSALQHLTLTQGADWPDTQILESNNFTVIANPYLAGFRAVRKRYVDAYPRALHEANLELESTVTRGLKIDEHHLLFYPNPLFFYVNREKPALAKRIEIGINMLIDTGELQQMLQSTRFYQRASNAFADREVYQLKNAVLSDVAKQAIDKYLNDEATLEYAQKQLFLENRKE